MANAPFQFAIGSKAWIHQHIIGAGAVIVGKVKIGDHVKIGAGAVVCTDIPSYSTVIAQPPSIIVRRAENV